MREGDTEIACMCMCERERERGGCERRIDRETELEREQGAHVAQPPHCRRDRQPERSSNLTGGNNRLLKTQLNRSIDLCQKHCEREKAAQGPGRSR